MKYRGWIYWVLCLAYYTVAIPLVCSWEDHTQAFHVLGILPIMLMIIVRGLEQRSYMSFIQINYPDEWGEFAANQLFPLFFRSYGRFSYLFLNEAEKDPQLLAAKKNNRDSQFVLCAVVVIGIVSSIIIHNLNG